MSSNKTPPGFRVFGQRLLPSSFASSPHITPVNAAADDEPRLKPNSGIPKTVKVKSRPFSSLLGLKDLTESTHEEMGTKKGEVGGKKRSVALAFEQFKHTEMGKGKSIATESAGEFECTDEGVVQESRKRRNPCQDGAHKHVARKYFAVLGGDPKPKLKRRRVETLISQEEPGHSYDHYENGCGWWDCNMEGIDNEEVGVNEVWEGVGSTTLGGIEWH